MIDPTFAGLFARPTGFTDRPLLWDDQSQRWLSERQVADLSLTLARQLEHGEKRLAFLLATNCSATLVGFLALAAAGHAIALIDPTLPEDKLAHLLDRYQPEIIAGAEKVHAIAAGTKADWAFTGGDTELPAIATRRSKAARAPLSSELGLLLLTSGTTGSSKFVRLSGNAVAANARQVADSLALSSDSVAISHLPFHYSYGLSVVTSHLAVGGRIAFISDSLTSDGFWAKVKACGGTHFPGVPFHYNVLARLGFDVVPASVDTFTQAGGHLDARIQSAVLAKAESRNARFFVMYGQTEASPRIACLPSARLHDKLGSVGVAMPGGRLSIIGPDGTPLAAGETGLVVYDGPNVMLGYAECRADLSRGDTMGGKLETGDLGRLDAEGFLYLSGRVARFAKIAGLRLSLDDMEKELARIGPIACVDLGERIALVVEGEVPPDAKACVKALALSCKIPPASFVLRGLPELPRKSSGKIDYARLKGALDV